MVIEPLLTIDDAAGYFNVKRRWVEDAAREGRLRFTRVGKHVRFRKEWLDDFLAAAERPVTMPAIPIQVGRRRGRL